jgi:hypothetical protein
LHRFMSHFDERAGVRPARRCLPCAAQAQRRHARERKPIPREFSPAPTKEKDAPDKWLVTATILTGLRMITRLHSRPDPGDCAQGPAESVVGPDDDGAGPGAALHRQHPRTQTSCRGTAAKTSDQSATTDHTLLPRCLELSDVSGSGRGRYDGWNDDECVHPMEGNEPVGQDTEGQADQEEGQASYI